MQTRKARAERYIDMTVYALGPAGLIVPPQNLLQLLSSC